MAASNLVERTTVPDPNDPVEKEFKKLMADDDAAEADADQWIQDNQKFAEKGAAIPDSEMKKKVRTRLEGISKEYEDFLEHHPDHARARVAYASLLHDLENEEGEMAQLLK